MTRIPVKLKILTIFIVFDKDWTFLNKKQEIIVKVDFNRIKKIISNYWPDLKLGIQQSTWSTKSCFLDSI